MSDLLIVRQSKLLRMSGRCEPDPGTRKGHAGDGDRGKSDGPIVLEKLPNKGGGVPSLAEGVEGRGSTKGKTMQEARSRTQRRKDLQERLDRVRQAASGLRV